VDQQPGMPWCRRCRFQASRTGVGMGSAGLRLDKVAATTLSRMTMTAWAWEGEAPRGVDGRWRRRGSDGDYASRVHWAGGSSPWGWPWAAESSDVVQTRRVAQSRATWLAVHIATLRQDRSPPSRSWILAGPPLQTIEFSPSRPLGLSESRL